MSLNKLSKDDVSSIQPRGILEQDEELRAIRILASIGHGQHATSSVLDLKVLIIKLGTVDGLATRAVLVLEITALRHESGDDAMENAALVAEALAVQRELLEVLDGYRDGVPEQREDHATLWSAANGYIEEYLVRDFGTRLGLSQGEQAQG